MKKKQTTKPSGRAKAPSSDVAKAADDRHDWEVLYRAFGEAFDWALDVAVAIARDFPEEIETVERVRRFVKAHLAGERAAIAIEDVLFTFGLLIGAIERDLGPVRLLGPWFATPTPMKFPSAHDELPKLPRVLFTRPMWSGVHPFMT